MSRHAYILPIYLLIVLAILLPVNVQAQNATTARQVMLSAVHIDAALRINGQQTDSTPARIQLWGMTPFSQDASPAALAARIMLEDLIQNQSVNCTIKEWSNAQSASAQCVNVNEKDLALAMIENGYALADKAAIGGTLFDSIYREAETKARRSNAGLWPSINNLNASQQGHGAVRAQNQTAFQLTEDTAYILIALMVAGPFVGMLIVAMITYGGFRRLISLQKYQMAMAQKKDRAMREREKFIVAASLESEINTNRAKLEAFAIIYEELLKNLRDPSKEPKYQKGGDIIHEKPALSRNVYDSNLDKMDLLGHQIVADLTGLYTMIEPNPDYKTIEPDTPIEDVIDFVNKIIRDAEIMLDPMDRVSGALNVIVRDKRAKTSNPIG